MVFSEAWAYLVSFWRTRHVEKILLSEEEFTRLKVSFEVDLLEKLQRQEKFISYELLPYIAPCFGRTELQRLVVAVFNLPEYESNLAGLFHLRTHPHHRKTIDIDPQDLAFLVNYLAVVHLPPETEGPLIPPLVTAVRSFISRLTRAEVLTPKRDLWLAFCEDLVKTGAGVHLIASPVTSEEFYEVLERETGVTVKKGGYPFEPQPRKRARVI